MRNVFPDSGIQVNDFKFGTYHIYAKREEAFVLLKNMIRQGFWAMAFFILAVVAMIYCVPRAYLYSQACRHGEVVATDVYDKGYLNLKLFHGEEEIYFTWDYQGNEPSLKEGDAILVYGEIDASTIGAGSNVDVMVAGTVISYVMLGVLVLSAIGFAVSVILALRSLKNGALKQFSLSNAKENFITAVFGFEVIGLFMATVYVTVAVGTLAVHVMRPETRVLTGEIARVDLVKTDEVQYNTTTHSPTNVYEKTIVVELDEPFAGETQYIKTYRERGQTITKEGSFAFVVLRSLDDTQGQVYTLENFIYVGIATAFLLLHQVLYRVLYAKEEKPPLMLLTWKLLTGKQGKPEEESFGK